MNLLFNADRVSCDLGGSTRAHALTMTTNMRLDSSRSTTRERRSCAVKVSRIDESPITRALGNPARPPGLRDDAADRAGRRDETRR